MKAWLGVVCVLLVSVPSVAEEKKRNLAEELVGRWDHSRTDAAYLRFNRDATFRLVTLTESTEGRFRLLTGGAIEFTFTTPVRGARRVEVKYRLGDDVLEIKIFKEWVKYKKAI